MKKLLSILAALGLTATTATSVVACSTTSLVSNAKIDSDGNVTFDVDGLTMSQDYDSIDLVNAHYSVFDKSGNHIKSAKLVSVGNSSTFKKDKKYSFKGTFKIENFKGNESYKFKFGTFGKNSMMAKSLGTIRVTTSGSSDNGGGTDNKSDVVSYSGSVQATFNKMPSQDQINNYFVLKDNSGNTINNVSYSFAPDSKALAVQLDEKVSGKLNYVYQLPKNKATKGDVTISASPAAISAGITDKDWSVKSTPSSYSPITITLSGDKLGSTDLPNNGGKADYYIDRPHMIDELSDEQATDIYKQLYGSDNLPADVKAELKTKSKNEEFSYGPAFKNMVITKDNVNTAGDYAVVGQPNVVPLKGWQDIVPDGSTYEFGFFNEKDENINDINNHEWYWIYLKFEKSDYKKSGTVEKEQTYMEGSIPSVTFKAVPTQEQMAEDFKVIDDSGKVIDGVKYTFKQDKKKNNASFVLAASEGVTGSVTYAIPVKKEDANKAPKPVTIAPAPGHEDDVPGFKAVTKTPKVFTLDGTELSGDNLDKNSDDEEGTFINIESIIEGLSDSSAKRINDDLFGNNIDEASAKKALLDNKDKITISAAKNYDITADNYNLAFDANEDGQLIDVNDVQPDGNVYQIGLHTTSGSKYHWINLGFDKKINTATQKDNESIAKIISTISITNETEEFDEASKITSNMFDRALDNEQQYVDQIQEMKISDNAKNILQSFFARLTGSRLGSSTTWMNNVTNSQLSGTVGIDNNMFTPEYISGLASQEEQNSESAKVLQNIYDFLIKAQSLNGNSFKENSYLSNQLNYSQLISMDSSQLKDVYSNAKKWLQENDQMTQDIFAGLNSEDDYNAFINKYSTSLRNTFYKNVLNYLTTATVFFVNNDSFDIDDDLNNPAADAVSRYQESISQYYQAINLFSADSKISKDNSLALASFNEIYNNVLNDNIKGIFPEDPSNPGKSEVKDALFDGNKHMIADLTNIPGDYGFQLFPNSSVSVDGKELSLTNGNVKGQATAIVTKGLLDIKFADGLNDGQKVTVQYDDMTGAHESASFTYKKLTPNSPESIKNSSSVLIKEFTPIDASEEFISASKLTAEDWDNAGTKKDENGLPEFPQSIKNMNIDNDVKAILQSFFGRLKGSKVSIHSMWLNNITNNNMTGIADIESGVFTPEFISQLIKSNKYSSESNLVLKNIYDFITSENSKGETSYLTMSDFYNQYFSESTDELKSNYASVSGWLNQKDNKQIASDIPQDPSDIAKWDNKYKDFEGGDSAEHYIAGVMKFLAIATAYFIKSNTYDVNPELNNYSGATDSMKYQQDISEYMQQIQVLSYSSRVNRNDIVMITNFNEIYYNIMNDNIKGINPPAEGSTLTNLSFNGARELDADATNMDGIGWNYPAINASFKINDQEIDMHQFSVYSGFQNGRLTIKWGNPNLLKHGDVVTISYNDAMGNRVSGTITY